MRLVETHIACFLFATGLLTACSNDPNDQVPKKDHIVAKEFNLNGISGLNLKTYAKKLITSAPTQVQISAQPSQDNTENIADKTS
jgi:hypothetical protein